MKFKNKFMNIYYNNYIKIKSILLINIIIFSFKNINKLFRLNEFLNKKNENVNLVIPIISKDFYKIAKNFKYYINFINGIKNVVLIGNEEIESLIKENNYSLNFPINFINEKMLLDVDKIKQLIKIRNITAYKRSGWYIQQFLKMIYCKICQDKYYLLWDSDTIPVKKVKMFKYNGKPIFDVKTEYNEQYFSTMKNIFPELGKKYDYSFISEHMIINSKIMENMINTINDNKNLFGDTWYEKIINCINTSHLPYSGFSEFETYGTFAEEYYKGVYIIRYWNSLREGILFFNPKFLTENDIKNISKNYYAISFEKYQEET